MTLPELKTLIIEKGLESVKTTYKDDDPRQAGGIEGFNKCKELDTPTEFTEAIRESRRKEWNIRKEDEGHNDLYVKQRYITLQIEYVFEILKVAWNHATPKLYSFPTISARATIQYAKFVGVKGQ